MNRTPVGSLKVTKFERTVNQSVQNDKYNPVMPCVVSRDGSSVMNSLHLHCFGLFKFQTVCNILDRKIS